MLIKKRNKLIEKLNYCKQFKSIYYLSSRRNLNSNNNNYDIFFYESNQQNRERLNEVYRNSLLKIEKSIYNNIKFLNLVIFSNNRKKFNQ